VIAEGCWFTQDAACPVPLAAAYRPAYVCLLFVVCPVLYRNGFVSGVRRARADYTKSAGRPPYLELEQTGRVLSPTAALTCLELLGDSANAGE
jgi:hypothetical protein